MEEKEGVVVDKTTKNKGKIKPWLLIVIFIILVLVIGGLVFLFTRKTEPVGEQEDAEVVCEEIADKHKMKVCLNHKEYDEDVGERFDAVLEKAFNDGDYEFFDEVVYDRSTRLALHDLCGRSLKWLEAIEEKYGSKLEITDLYALYVSGKESAQECNKPEKIAYYENKIKEVFASEAYSEAVKNDDYRVIGVDTPEGEEEEGEEDEE